MPKTSKTTKKTVKKPRKLQATSKNSSATSSAELTQPTETTVPGAFKLMASSLKVLRDHWKLFLGIVVIYGLLSLLLGQSLSSGAISQAKANLDNGVKGGDLGGLLSSTLVFASISNALCIPCHLNS
jgi:hypothetical protein